MSHPLDDALAAAGILTVTLDRAGVVRSASAAAQLLLAWPPTALVGRPIAELLFADHAIMAEYQLVRGTAPTLTTAWKWRTGAGELRPLTATWHQRADGWTGVITRTALTAAAPAPLDRGPRHLLEAQRLARVGSFTYEVATGQVSWSDMMYQLHDRDPSRPPTVTQAEYLAIGHPDDVDRMFAAGRAALASAGEAEATYRVRRADGSWRHLQTRMVCERTDDGTPILITGIVKDVSDELLARDELIRDRERARDDAAAKTRFLAQVTHELRTPLAGVIGMIDLASTDTSATARGDHLASARASARHLLELIDDLLDASREDSWTINVVTIDFDLRDVVAQALAMVSPRARKKGLLLQAEVAEMITARRGDPLRLRQILVNLLYNAVKYTPRGRVSISVVAQDDGVIVFTIADTGVGIATEQQAAVFEPFVQAHGDDVNEGVGLGLAITRELISLLGGTIVLRSEVGTGTEVTVTLTLPTSTGPSADRLRAIDPGSTPSLPLLPVNSRSLRILVAEDHATNAAIAMAILERAGHRPLWVGTGAAAVAAVAAERFDAVLMDLEMPELDGAEATRRIRAAEHRGGALRLPIIALSAHKHAEGTAAAAGMDAYLGKPLDAIALGELLERVIGGDLRGPIDHMARLAKVGGRAELARTIVGTFLSHQPTLIDMIDAALAARHAEDLRRAAHGLRGALLMVGAVEAATIADELEQRTLEPRDLDEAIRLRHRLAIEIARAGAELALAQ
ncbi:MAG: response regulator [Myxococcales bacterium]|nr:response regulator [Myxococcales bacterium]